MLWMVEHSAELVAKRLVCKDGKTVCDRAKWKKARVVGGAFGEKVFWRKLEEAEGEQAGEVEK